MDSARTFDALGKRLVFFGIATTLGCGAETSPMPGGYYVFQDSSHQVTVAPRAIYPETPFIPEKVVGVWWDERYIVGQQRPLIPRSFDQRDGVMVPNAGAPLNYWLIDVGLNKRTGPMSESEWKVFAQEIGILERVRFRRPRERKDARPRTDER